MENNVFEQMAKRYDTEERMKLAKVISDEVRGELQNHKSKSLIDYGSGTGLVSLELSGLVDSLLLIDSSQQMLDIAKEKITQNGIRNTNVLHADFSQNDPEMKADIVIMSLVLLHVPDTKQILQQIFNILNHDGELILVDFDKNENVTHPKVHNGFSHGELQNLLAELGFQNTTIRSFYEGKGIFVNEDASMFICKSKK